MKKIIVPIDFSEYSEYALETAAQLAKKNNAEILALHMLELSEALLNRTGTAVQMETVFFLKLAEKKFDEFLNKAYLKGITVTPIVKHFKVFSEVNEIAEAYGADLIVMGSHGASGMRELFIGSNTEKVVRHSNIPVLIIKHNPILIDFEHVVFACDFSDEAIKPYINASKCFKKMGSKIHLIYVNVPNDGFRSTLEMEHKVHAFFKKLNGNSNQNHEVIYFSDYTVEDGIINYAHSIGADLIALSTHGRTGLAHLLEGSISEDVANHSTLPVMTFKI
jgi:nucleotide-binding universal stress UspA family protein